MVLNSTRRFDKKAAILAAKKLVSRNALVLDTETTGLGTQDEIVELSIIDMGGGVLINTLVKPTILITPGASAIHGISNTDISSAPYITQILPELTHMLKNNIIAIYNAEFDLRMLRQSLNAHGKTTPHYLHNNVYCIMELYSIFNGEFDEIKMRYKWIELSVAASRLGIVVPQTLHRAKIDAELTRQVILRIADSECSNIDS